MTTVVSDKTEIVINTASRRFGADNEPTYLYIPIDRMGNVKPVEKADCLECWVYCKEKSRRFLPEHISGVLAKGIVSSIDEEEYTPVLSWIKTKTAKNFKHWAHHLHRMPSKDIYRFRVSVV